MKLPDKFQGRRDDYGVTMSAVELKINNIIDYLAEREERTAEQIDSTILPPTPLFKVDAEQAREALLKLTQ